MSLISRIISGFHSTWLRVAILSLSISLSTSPGVADDLHIGTITLRTLDVFSAEEAGSGWLYRTANGLHIQTRPSFVRRFLLFREGDPYDPEVLAQTERNLRALRFLKAARVTASAPRDGLVNVEVVTEDAWSFEVGGNVGNTGGSSTGGAEITETNILGTGRRFSLLYDKLDQRSKLGVRLLDPSFIRPYVSAELAYSENSDGKEQRLIIGRPFYALNVPSMFRSGVLGVDSEVEIYENSYVSERFSERHETAFVEYGRAVHLGAGHAHRLFAGLELVRDTFSPAVEPLGTELPDDRDYRYATIGYEYVQNRYQKMNFVNRDLRFEDFNLGMQFSTRLGISPTLFGASETTGFASASLARGWSLGPEAFVMPRLAYETRLGTDARNARFRADVNFIRKFETSKPQTFVSRLSWRRGWDLDRDFQFFADGDNGLRAYRLYAFSGDKSVILNFEHRIFLGRELFHLISPGAAIFFDAGNATPNGMPLNFGDLKKDVGFGLRFGAGRSPKGIFRLDYACALDPDPRGKKGCLISFSGSQAF